MILIEDQLGNVLATRDVPANVPSVTMLSPQPGSVMPGFPVNVSWSGGHPDSLPLTYSVMISDDTGTSWTPLAIDTSTTSLTINGTSVINATRFDIRVVATDVVNSGEALTYFTTPQLHTLTFGLDPPAGGSTIKSDEQSHDRDSHRSRQSDR